MRLIDADALIRELNDRKIGYRADINKIICGMTVYEPAIVQPQWVPVIEKLPENEGDFIVTANDSITGLFVVKDHCYKGTDGKMRFLNQIDGNPYHNHDGELKRHTRNITAWMQIPEPYKEASK